MIEFTKMRGRKDLEKRIGIKPVDKQKAMTNLLRIIAS